MNTDKRRAVFTLVGALAIGILLGLLIPAIFHKVGDRRRREERGITQAIYRIIRPDSSQMPKIRPIADWAAKRLDSLESSSNAQFALVMDSIKLKLKPIITEEQYKRLDGFGSHTRGHRGERRGNR